MDTPAPPHRDDGLEWLREIRRQISAEFGHDQKRIGDYLRQREKEYGGYILRPSNAFTYSIMDVFD